MGVLKVNVGDAVTPEWRKIGCGGTADPPDWIAFKTITPTTGTHTVTFDEPVTLQPGVDYWMVLQNCATNCQRSGSGVATGVSFPNGKEAYYSFSGGGFGSFDSGTAFMLFTLEAVTGSDATVTHSPPDDYWGPSTVAQLFQVTSPIDVEGLTAYWGGAASAGKWGIARAITAPTGRLKLWDGTRWVREVCDDDTAGSVVFADDFNRADSSSSAGPGWSTAFYNSAGTPAWGVDTNRAYVVGAGTGAVLYRDVGASDGVVEVDIPVLPVGTGDDSGIVFRYDSPGNLWFISGQRISLYYGGSPISVGTTASYIAAGDHLKVVLNGDSIIVYRNGVEWQNVTDSRLATATKHGLIGDTNFGPAVRYDNWSFTNLLERHPLKMWDGTTWQTVACLTPA